MSGNVVIKVEGPVGYLVFDHPERKNAITVDMWRRIPSAIRELDANAAVRVIVMRGAGDEAFVSGADISEFGESRSGDAALTYEQETLAAFSALEQAEKPTVAMIHGYCIGGGVAIALSADLRYAADDATFAVPAARLGLGYHVSGVQALIRAVGESAAKEIFFTARRFTAPEALERGLVNAALPKDQLEPFVRKTAEQIAENAPLTIRSMKRVARELSLAKDHRDEEGMSASIAACFHSADYAEGVRAFLEKRRPVFRGR